MNPFDIIRTILRGLLPKRIVAFLDRLAEAALAKLQGEPLRLISYGAVVVLWFSTRIADAIIPGRLPLVSIDVAMGVVTIAIAVVTEFARRWVSSPATVAQIEAEHAEVVDQLRGNAVGWIPVAASETSTPDPLEDLAAAEANA